MKRLTMNNRPRSRQPTVQLQWIAVIMVSSAAWIFPAISAGQRPGWMERAYGQPIPEIDLTDHVKKYPIVIAGRQWPCHWVARGEVGKRHPSVRHNPELARIPEYRDFVEGTERPKRPKPGSEGGGYWPLLIRLNDAETGKRTDRLACLFRTGAIHIGPGGNIALAFSDDRGKTWSAPKTVVAYDKRLRFDYRHGSFGQAHNGDLLAMYWLSGTWTWELEKIDQPNVKGVRLVRSADMGRTWSEPVDLKLRKKIGFGVSPYGPIRRIGKRTLVANVREGRTDKSYLAWSYDDGQTWPEITVIGTDRKTETWVLPLNSKEWVGYTRSGAGGAWICHSHDGAKTWPDWQRIEPYRRRVPGCIVKLPHNRLAVIHTYRQYPFGIRAFLSHDGGRTFDTDLSYVLCDSFWMEDCGYPSAVVFEDGTVVVAAYATKDREHPQWGTCAMTLVFEASLLKDSR